MSSSDKNPYTRDPRLWLIVLALMLLVLVFVRTFPG